MHEQYLQMINDMCGYDMTLRYTTVGHYHKLIESIESSSHSNHLLGKQAASAEKYLKIKHQNIF